MSEPRLRLTIDRLGHRGDGVADDAGREVFVPLALAGETVEVAVAEDHNGRRGRLLEVVTPSPDRVAAPCAHFGTCGSCALQMMAPAAYLAWKREIVVAAFADRGIEADVRPVAPTRPRGRRRAVFAARREGRDVALGFRERLAHTVVEIAECHVVTPAILAARAGLKRLVEPLPLPKKGLQMTVVDTSTGLDVAIEAAEADAGLRRGLIAIAAELGLARLSLGPDVLVEIRPPAVDLGGVAVVPPPGGFLQAVAEAEALLADLVLEGTAGAKRVADLFAGVGTFTFRLARTANVHAVEADRGAVTALERARARATGLRPITTEVRDLYRRPLFAPELSKFDAVVFDPPRDGATAEAKEIGKSKLARAVAVSCNPATLARDARVLLDAGFRMGPVFPVDQFLWTPHVEAVTVFTR